DADQNGVLEVELVQEIEIEIGEVVDGRERLRLLGTAEPRMARRDHPRVPREVVEHGCVTVEPDGRMQEQERAPASLLDRLHPHPVDFEGCAQILHCHKPNPTLQHSQLIPLLYYAKSAAPMKIGGCFGPN